MMPLVWAMVLAFFGLNTALVAWFIVRFTITGDHGGLLAILAFNAVLIATCFGVVKVASA